MGRAIYQEREIYLLDDPLSAVDVHVGKHIFEKVVGPRGLLNNKVGISAKPSRAWNVFLLTLGYLLREFQTRVLVTHGLTFLSKCDLIILMKDGRIWQQGTYEDLLAEQGLFADLVEEFLEKAPDDELDGNGIFTRKIRTSFLFFNHFVVFIVCFYCSST